MSIYVPITPNPHLTRSWSRCHAALFGAGPDAMPPKAWEHNIAGHLFERGYHPDSIRIVLDHVALFGTAKGCTELDFSTSAGRAAVERLCPRRPVAVWPMPGSPEAAEFGPVLI